MKALTFLVELHEPLLASQVRSGEANSAITYPFIPGSMIRGALATQYMAGGTVVDLEKNKTFSRLFLDGTVCYLNAYLAHPDNRSRALPKPLSWFVLKENADDPTPDIFDFVFKEQGGQSYKVPDGGDFVWQIGSSVALISPNRASIVHNTSRNPNRKDQESSDVYRYEALAPEQIFAGAIVSEDVVLLKEIEPLLKTLLSDKLERGVFNLGGSHTAGYGRVSTSLLGLDPDWHEFEPILANDNSEQYEYNEEGEERSVVDETAPKLAILTCLSDLIWRDRSGQISSHLTTPSGIKPEKAFYRLRPVGGFNRKWGLPLCQAWAIQAGSVFVFPATCYGELEEWVTKGVGERRAEGFGRVALNWHPSAKIDQTAPPAFRLAAPEKPLSDESYRLAQQMANRQLQGQVDRQLVRRISELSHFQNLPKTVHLSRARLAAQRAWRKGNLQEIATHFNNLSPTAVKQWERAKIKGEPFKDWILKVDSLPNLIDELPKVAGVEARFDSIHEVTLARLVEGVLRRAVKQAKARDEGGNDGSVES